MLFTFEGAPSTSRFCTWVNEPREAEELPADWRPDETPVRALPADRLF
jgi:hypothetical protein